MTLETVLLVSKITGSVFAGVYGLYATVTDFHETRDGKRSLSSKGKLGLSILLVATVLNVTSDGIKQKADIKAGHDESLKRDAETKRIQSINTQLDKELSASATMSSTLRDAVVILHQTSKTASQNIRETDRLLDPIYDSMIAEAYFSIPFIQAPMVSYLERVQGKNVSLGLGQEGFPIDGKREEQDLYNFLTRETIEIDFSKNTNANVITFHMDCTLPLAKSTEFELNLGAQDLRFLCRGLVKQGVNDGSFHSFDDLKSATAHISITDLVTQPRTSQILFSLNRLVIHATNSDQGRLWIGRKLTLDRLAPDKSFGGPYYKARISLLPSRNEEPN